MAVLAGLTALTFSVLAQTYPSRPIKWVVAYPPGGGTDFLARTLGAQMAKQMGQPVVIDNRPGGAGMIGAEMVARSPADGYTVFTGDNGTLVYNPALFKKVPYAPQTDFAAVSMMARFPLILLANNNAPFGNARALIEQIKSKPGQLSYASPGMGSPHHLAMELLKQRANLFILHVPYRGSGGAIQDLMGGQIQLFVADSAAALPLVRSDKVKALAVFSKSRMPALPDVPTFAELGYTDVEAYGWQGMVVPANTPKDMVARLNQELGLAMQNPEVTRKFADFGLDLIPGTPESMARYLAEETRVWHQLIRDRQIVLE
jgi:tripartite-type tricarboxylate transporter receptor subunit TctC